MSPVRANVTIISSSLTKELTDPLTSELETVNHPVLFVNPEIINKAYALESNFLLILKCPLIVDDESSIVFKNDVISAVSSLESMYISVVEFNAILLNLNRPVPGSLLVVNSSNV